MTRGRTGRAPLHYATPPLAGLKARGKLGREGRELTPDTSVSPPLLKIEGEEREGKGQQSHPADAEDGAAYGCRWAAIQRRNQYENRHQAVRRNPPNNSMQLTAILLRSKASGELDRQASKQH